MTEEAAGTRSVRRKARRRAALLRRFVVVAIALAVAVALWLWVFPWIDREWVNNPNIGL